MANSLRALLLLAVFTGVFAGRIKRDKPLEVDANSTRIFTSTPTGHSPIDTSREPCYLLVDAVDQCSNLLGHDEVLRLCEQHYSNETHDDDEKILNINEFIENWRNETASGNPNSTVALPSRPLSLIISRDEKTINITNQTSTVRAQHDWREGQKTIVELSRGILQNEKLADYTFIVGEDKTEIKAHSQFLARTSSFFETLFLEETQKRVLVPDASPAAFRVLLDYAYTGEFCLEDFSTACELVGLSASMALPELRQQSLQYLEDELHPDNVWKAMQCASKINSSQMMNFTLKMVETYTQSALSNPTFVDISHDNLMKFLKMNSMNITSELQVLDATLRWARAEAARRSMTPDPETLRTVLGPALGLIRFLTLTPREFANMQSTSKLLNCDENLAVIFNLNAPGVTPLLSTISRINTTRNSNISAVTSYYNIKTSNVTSCSKPQHSINNGTFDVPSFPLLYTRNYNHELIRVKAIQIPSQVCLLLNSHTYNEDLTVKIVEHSGKSLVTSYRYTKMVPCNSLLAIKFPQSVVLRYSTYYEIKITFHKSGKYPKDFSKRTSRNWPILRNLENVASQFYEYNGQFLDSIITDDSDDFNF